MTNKNFLECLHFCSTLMYLCVLRDQDQDVEPSKPKERLQARKNVCCTDIIFLLLIIAFWGFLVRIRIFHFICMLKAFLGDIWRTCLPRMSNLSPVNPVCYTCCFNTKSFALWI